MQEGARGSCLDVLAGGEWVVLRRLGRRNSKKQRKKSILQDASWVASWCAMVNKIIIWHTPSSYVVSKTTIIQLLAIKL